MVIIGYARASTEDQKLDAQIEQLKEAKCERIYEEKVSGAKGKFKGRKTTAWEKSAEVMKLVADVLIRETVAEMVGIGVVSVCRIVKTAKEDAKNMGVTSTDK